MGLDMYLTAEVYIGGAYHEIEPKSIGVSKRFKNSNNETPVTFDTYPTEDIDSLIYQVGYWRKANQIHRWFVDNVENGIDDNGVPHYVSKEQIEELRELCTELLHSKDQKKALELLPPMKGFFFGATDPEQKGFWEWYWEDLEATLLILDKALYFIEKYDADIKYSSSW